MSTEQQTSGNDNLDLVVSREHDESSVMSGSVALYLNEENAVDANSFDKEYRECIETFHKLDKNNVKERFVRCKVCVSMPNIVKLNSDNHKMAPMTTSEGCRYRKRYVSEHFQSKYHKVCRMTVNIPIDTNAKNTIDFHVKKVDEKMFSHVSKILFEIYVDSKKLTSSAHSWPARFVGSEAGRSFNYNDINAPTVDPSLNLQYINKVSHLDFLSMIVESDKSTFQTKLEKSIAASIRVDGSVDRSQIDKIYIMLKIIAADGAKELLFLGISEQTARGAKGLFEAVKQGMIDNIGEEMYVVVMKKISSICTDGTNVNSGEKGGLWAFFEKEIRRVGSTLPLMKIWCSARC